MRHQRIVILMLALPFLAAGTAVAGAHNDDEPPLRKRDIKPRLSNAERLLLKEIERAFPWAPDPPARSGLEDIVRRYSGETDSKIQDKIKNELVEYLTYYPELAHDDKWRKKESKLMKKERDRRRAKLASDVDALLERTIPTAAQRAELERKYAFFAAPPTPKEVLASTVKVWDRSGEDPKNAAFNHGGKTYFSYTLNGQTSYFQVPVQEPGYYTVKTTKPRVRVDFFSDNLGGVHPFSTTEPQISYMSEKERDRYFGERELRATAVSESAFVKVMRQATVVDWDLLQKGRARKWEQSERSRGMRGPN